MKKKLKRILLIGPVYPYKSGISQYTSLLYKALSEKYQVVMVSFCLQYPKLLFRKEQKDYENQTLLIEDTNYWINTANPFNWFFSAYKIKEKTPDLIIFQWWHPYFTPCYLILENLLRKTPHFFVCHNVLPHERFWGDKILAKLALSKGAGYFVHSKMDKAELFEIRPNAQCVLSPLPTFNAFPRTGMTREEMRKHLNVESFQNILLFFGLIREYKGLKYLLDAMSIIIQENPKIKLIIAGEFSEEKEPYLKQVSSLGLDTYVDIYDEYIPDSKVEQFFIASDLVVLPYISATQSAVVQTAYSFERPVIVTNVGGLPEVVEDGKTGYVVESENSQALAEGIMKFFKQNNIEKFHNYIKQEAHRYTWERMVEKIEKLFQE